MSYTSENPNKSSGQYHSTKGTAVEAIGNLTGAQSWQQSGKEEHAAGETEYNAAQAKGYVEGVGDRVGGKVDSVAGAVKGDQQQQASGNIRHEGGKAKQDINKPE
ncbi:unnamed protein product [Peniophora sp. CBMAI 1063]|nr:unnamed protein product [Peniophora sp. CBMAI 1063]